MNRLHAFVALLVFLPVPAWADAPPLQDPLLDQMVGTWVLKGLIAGHETTHDVVAEWVLGHQYVRVHEISREKDAKGQPVYEAIVFVGRDAPSDGYACLWLDSTGGGGLAAQSIGHAKRSGDELAFLFKDKGGDFHTTFAFETASGSWRWSMDAETGGKLQVFARVKLTK